MKKRILVTGGAGFIGSHIVEHHLAKGDEVWALDNLSTGSIDNVLIFKQYPAFRFIEADLLTWDGLAAAISWADAIYHMAAMVGQFFVIQHPAQVLKSNCDGCERILHLVSVHNPRCALLVASSSEVYGHHAQSFREDAFLAFPSGECIQSNYALSKYVNEACALSYVHEKGLNCVIARLFNTIGIRQHGHYGMVVPRFIRQALDNEDLTVYGDGAQTRSFCDVKDTVNILEQLLFHQQAAGKIFNVGNDHEISIFQLAEHVKAKTHSRSPIVFIPYEKAYGMPFEDTQRRKPDLTKLKTFLGAIPQTPLDQALETIILHSRIECI